ncbi:MAG: hypothetical protein U9R49_01105 [Bacteroidota bacterium]|nr:hypothetical protein [Bacteroidota bacterium]
MYRIISGILLLCFSAFLGHNLVPHHHSEELHSPIATSCPLEHGDTHDHDHDADEHPTHCHAFNDVVFEKFNAPSLRPWTGSIQAMIVPGASKLPEKEQHCSPYIYAVLKPLCVTAVYLGSRDLRAPPVFV